MKKRKRKNIEEPFNNAAEMPDGSEPAAAEGGESASKRPRIKQAYCVNKDKYWVVVTEAELKGTELKFTDSEENDELVHRVLQHKIRLLNISLKIMCACYYFFLG